MTGGVVGGTVGYNYQIGPAVIGVEGDIDWSDINGTTTTGGCLAGCTTGSSWLSTVRGRVGVCGGPLHALCHRRRRVRQHQRCDAGPRGRHRDECWLDGRRRARIRNRRPLVGEAEYLYVDLGKFNCGAGWPRRDDNVSFTTSLVRAGINYRF